MKRTLLFLFSITLLLFVSCKKDDVVDGQWQEPESTPDSPYTKRVEFKTTDDVLVSADIYHINRDYPMIILCHGEGKSRGEYEFIGPKFNELGYNCLAIDLRSGDETNGVINRTAWFNKDKVKGIPEDYVDSEKDIIAAVDYASGMSDKKIILLGSRFSAGLVMKVAAENSKVNIVLAFSPGDTYSPLLDIKAKIASLDKPVFITSSQGAAPSVKEFFDAVPTTYKVQFIPSLTHKFDGAFVLESNGAIGTEYWNAVKSFLGK